MNAMNEMPSALVFTDAAAAKVRTLIDEEGNPDLKLRVFVSGGGCSGFQYGFTFDEVVNEDDTAMQKAGVTLRGNRLPGRAGRRAVRHQESERPDHLRLRLELFDLNPRQVPASQGPAAGPFVLGPVVRPSLLQRG